MTTMPFDENPARRPAVSDLGGAAKLNGPVAPNPVTMLTADQENIGEQVSAAVAGVCPLAILVVTQIAGVYSVTGFRCVGSNVVVGNITVTKNGVGDVTYSWTAGLLAGTLTAHTTLNAGAGAYRSPETTLPNGTSVRVKMTDGTGAAVECNHTVWLY